MEPVDIYSLRETFNDRQIMLCFNGPFSATLIEEIGKALRNHMQGLEESPSAVSDVFSVYIEMTQNIRRYTAGLSLQGRDATSTLVVSRDDAGHYVVSAGNVVQVADGESLVARVETLSRLSKDELKSLFKAQLRQPREALAGAGAGLGMIDMARKASQPLRCALQPLTSHLAFFSLRVVL